jgi:FixJ family two-component response regulator
MSGHGDIAMSVRAMKAGAVDFLAKPFRDQDIIDAVLAALDRDRDRLATEGALEAASRRHAALTRRETEVMALVVAGQMIAGIAMDHFGVFGLAQHPVSISRLAGIALIIGGVLLIKD